ncbi:SusD/RagB family nutrient-binding outer membrane lipoprotein [Maribellus maritimus]|uniref:SusD/RagB family nutrient-binding outer membrane lipoprotein n=1 Tax=Maribellus maritimus TaxID=2870838 RepID=UPI001EE9E411|nr:SusD/RagB family nutrient-binding outer membrane lipoprotein [Maribellus maritimus]MCG6188605.1 SusD/RagB family nutrient-binding outer membrane lipoprotein [Maribellus maritimus]
MKNIKYIITRFSVLLLFLMHWGCENSLVEMNENPNAVTSIDDKFLFTSAVKSTIEESPGSFDLRMGSQYSHMYVSPGLGRQADRYEDYNDPVYNATLTGKFTGPIKYINEIILLNEDEDGNPHNEVKLALVHILSVCNFAKLTDLYGSIPYTEGGWGRKNILYPAYDSQEFIYNDMLDKLKSSIDVLKSANPEDAYPGFDPLYENDLSKWVRFANSLRLRLAMRARFIDPTKSAQIISECLSNPLIETNEQNAQLQHDGGDVEELNNPWYNLFVVKEKWKMGELFVNWLKITNDPRLPIFVEANQNGEYYGIKNGLTDLDHGNAFSQSMYCYPAEALYAKDRPSYFLCADEVAFLKAEAALFGLGTGDANAFYQEGIQKAMEKWNVPQDQITTFLTNEAEAMLTGSDEEKFEQISTQVWIALIPNFAEIFSNMRRTDYPVIEQRGEDMARGVTDGYFPKRLIYGTDELSTNPENVANAIAQQGPNKITTALWWDVK